MTTTSNSQASVVDTDTFTVRRTVHVAAPVEKVWAAVTEAEHISRWFGRAEIAGRGVGATGTLTWPDHGPIPLRVEAFDEPHTVSYRWSNDDALGTAPAGLDVEHSTVFTFTLEPVAGRHPAHRGGDRVRGHLGPAREPRGPPRRLGRRARQAGRAARGRLVTTGTMVPVFAALGDETRWSVLAALGEGDASASALAGRLPVSRQAIAKHLAVLQEVGLVEPVRVGREVRYRVLGAQLRATATRLDEIGTEWDRRLAAIKEIAENL